jgi:hypothetical protein
VHARQALLTLSYTPAPNLILRKKWKNIKFKEKNSGVILPEIRSSLFHTLNVILIITVTAL